MGKKTSLERSVNRRQILRDDLEKYQPRSWKISLPVRDYTIRAEDAIPALAGTIGKISLIAAFVLAWMDAYSINDPVMAAANVRLELFVGSVLTLIFCVFLNTEMAPPGTLAPLIPLIPLMAVKGVHPLPLALLSGFLGILLSLFKAFPYLVRFNGTGTKAGILMLFGIMGIQSSIGGLGRWSINNEVPWLLFFLLLAGGLIFVVLYLRQQTWLTIPLCALVGLSLPMLFGIFPSFTSSPALPVINPALWWLEKWGIGWGLDAATIINSLPFAVLIVVMWPLDAVAITAMHERNYAQYGEKLIFRLNPSFLLASIRNIIGAFLGGAQTAAVWRSFLIPLGVVRRPIPGAAFLLALSGIVFSLTGYPIDLAMFVPLINLVLIMGVFLPMFITGIQIVRSLKEWSIAIICVTAGYFISPLIGWLLSVLIDLLLARFAAFNKRGRL